MPRDVSRAGSGLHRNPDTINPYCTASHRTALHHATPHYQYCRSPKSHRITPHGPAIMLHSHPQTERHHTRPRRNIIARRRPHHTQMVPPHTHTPSRQNYRSRHNDKKSSRARTHVSGVVQDDELRPVEARLSVAGVRGSPVVLLVEQIQQVFVCEGRSHRRHSPSG